MRRVGPHRPGVGRRRESFSGDPESAGELGVGGGRGVGGGARSSRSIPSRPRRGVFGLGGVRPAVHRFAGVGRAGSRIRSSRCRPASSLASSSPRCRPLRPSRVRPLRPKTTLSRARGSRRPLRSPPPPRRRRPLAWGRRRSRGWRCTPRRGRARRTQRRGGPRAAERPLEEHSATAGEGARERARACAGGRSPFGAVKKTTTPPARSTPPAMKPIVEIVAELSALFRLLTAWL